MRHWLIYRSKLTTGLTGDLRKIEEKNVPATD